MIFVWSFCTSFNQKVHMKISPKTEIVFNVNNSSYSTEIYCSKFSLEKLQIRAI